MVNFLRLKIFTEINYIFFKIYILFLETEKFFESNIEVGGGPSKSNEVLKNEESTSTSDVSLDNFLTSSFDILY